MRRVFRGPSLGFENLLLRHGLKGGVPMHMAPKKETQDKWSQKFSHSVDGYEILLHQLDC